MNVLRAHGEDGIPVRNFFFVYDVVWSRDEEELLEARYLISAVVVGLVPKALPKHQDVRSSVSQLPAFASQACYTCTLRLPHKYSLSILFHSSA